MLRKFFASAFLLSATITLSAQENVVVNNSTPPAETTVKSEAPPEIKPALTISGSVDAYFKYDFRKQAGNNKTSFTNSQNAFALGMASVKFEHVGSKVGMVADLGFGPRAQEFTYNDAGLLSAVKQMYVSYTPVEGLKFTAGTWATHCGYELPDPQLNRNYSTSYLFTNGPFSHTGVKAEFTKGKSGFMLGLSNATDYRIPPAGKINKKFVLAQYSIAASDAVKLYFNYMSGKAPDTSVVSQYDFVATAAVNKKFSIGFNASLNRSQAWDGEEKKNLSGKNWWGTAAYLNVDPKDWFGLTLRSELFNDVDGVKGFNTSIFANTLSANFKVEGFTLIPELRFESAGQPIYGDVNGLINQKSAVSFVLAAVYKF